MKVSFPDSQLKTLIQLHAAAQEAIKTNPDLSYRAALRIALDSTAEPDIESAKMAAHEKAVKFCKDNPSASYAEQLFKHL